MKLLQGTINLKRLSIGFSAAVCVAILLLFLSLPITQGVALQPENQYLPWIAREYPTPQPTPFPSRLIISEVMVDPSGLEPDNEWFEVYNPGDSAISLSSYKIGDEEERDGGEGMYRFPAGRTIQAHQVLVIAVRAAAFRARYGYSPDYELRESDDKVPKMAVYSQWATGQMQLSVAGDELIILGSRDILVDALSWGSSYAGLNPPVPRPNEDYSLARMPAYMDTDTALDWVEQPPDPGVVDARVPTPTPSNTPTLTPPYNFVINEIHADPDYAYGDANGDGWADQSEDEFVEIINAGTVQVDMSGWRLERGWGDMRHDFPAGTLLAPGKALVIFGGGTPSGAFGGSLIHTASAGSLELMNTGDILSLVDDEDHMVVAYTYDIEAGDNQSITRSPDVTGLDPLLKHSLAPGSGGTTFSPGTRVDGSSFGE